MTRISVPHEGDNEVARQSAPPNGKTILLAEDDPFIARMYDIKLTSAGYTVLRTNNGRDTYERIKADNPDLIMLDVNMPELSGFEVIAALQGELSGEWADKIIVLTNSANPKDRQTAQDLGIDYLIKADLTPKDVLDHINQKLKITP